MLWKRSCLFIRKITAIRLVRLIRLFLPQLRYTVVLAFFMPAFAQGRDLSVVAGAGGFLGDEVRKGGVAAVGFSIGFPYDSKHRFQFDYLSNKLLSGSQESEAAYFLTGSYVIQSTKGRARPFFQIGIGGVRLKGKTRTISYYGERIVISENGRNSTAVIFGTGATIDISKSVFLRPQILLYGHLGPTFTILPSIGAGWRF